MNFRVRVPCALALGVVLACGACSQTPERAATVEGTSAIGATTSATPVEKPSGSRQQLTQGQVDAALLTVAELPTGFAAQTSSTSSTTQGPATVSPAECQAIFDQLKPNEKTAVAKGSASFTQGGMFGALLAEGIGSYTSNDRGDAVKGIADSLSKCPSFTSTQGSSITSFEATPLSFPNLGDQTFAARLTGKSQGFTIILDIVVVGLGHNTISFAGGGLQPMNPADLEKVARAGVDKLGKVVA